MGLQGDGSGTRGAVVQTLIALAIILVAFRVADVAPSRLESRAVAGELAWTTHIRAGQEALDRKDVSAAARAWHEAYAAALASPRWEGLVAAGDAALRIGEVSGSRRASEAKARTAYLTAFFRARQHGVVEGMRRTAEAFAALADYEIAARLAAEVRRHESRAIASGATAR